MKCKNCGLPRDAHIPATDAVSGRRIWRCPDGSGDTYPAETDAKVELYYRAGEDDPWLARWVHPTAGEGDVVSKKATDALEAAGRRIEKMLEEKPPEQIATEKAIKER
jgi:hypothetical protein